jgi:hypothetical protein
MAKSRFSPIKQEMLNSRNDPKKVRVIIRILSMGARERIRAFEQGRFDKSIWMFFGHISRKYAASRNLCRKITQENFSFFCVDY